MVVLQQLNLSIEESHNANDGNAKGCGEKHFVEHLFLLFSDPGLGHMARISSPRNKLDWRDNRPARTARVDPLRCSRSQRKALQKRPARVPGVNPLQRSPSQGINPPKTYATPATSASTNSITTKQGRGPIAAGPSACLCSTHRRHRLCFPT